MTENVLDLMAAKIEKLPEATQELLQLASCIGHQCDLHTLPIIAQRPPRETLVHLWHACEEGLLVPVDRHYADVDLATTQLDDL